MSLRPSNKQKNAAPVSAPQTRLDMVLRAGLRVPTSCGYTEKIIDLNDWEFSTNARIELHYGEVVTWTALWNTTNDDMYIGGSFKGDYWSKGSLKDKGTVKELMNATQAELDMLTNTLPNACSSLLGAIESRKNSAPLSASQRTLLDMVLRAGLRVPTSCGYDDMDFEEAFKQPPNAFPRDSDQAYFDRGASDDIKDTVLNGWMYSMDAKIKNEKEGRPALYKNGTDQVYVLASTGIITETLSRFYKAQSNFQSLAKAKGNYTVLQQLIKLTKTGTTIYSIIHDMLPSDASKDKSKPLQPPIRRQ
jgi:chitodextrinase